MEILVNPRVLEWARTEAGFTLEDAASDLNLTSAELENLECGQSQPRLTLLRAMARKYGRPLAALGMPDPPPPTERPEDFRTVRGRAPRLSPKTLRAIRAAESYQSSAGHIASHFPEIGEAPVLRRVSLADQPDILATYVRRRLGISISDQLRWRSPTQAFRTWRWRLEDLGILVVAGKVPRNDCRGFSLWPENEPIPLIFVNNEEVEAARCFTLLHEFAHLSLRRAGICLEQQHGIDKVRVERFCNRVAASVLMPRSAVHQVIQETHGSVERQAWDIDLLYRMARRLRVSGLSLALRLEELGLAPTGYFDEVQAERGIDQWQGGGFGRSEYHERQLTKLGSRYTHLVLEATDRGILSTVDAYRMLDTSARYFGDLRTLLVERSSVYGR